MCTRVVYSGTNGMVATGRTRLYTGATVQVYGCKGSYLVLANYFLG